MPKTWQCSKQKAKNRAAHIPASIHILFYYTIFIVFRWQWKAYKVCYICIFTRNYFEREKYLAPTYTFRLFRIKNKNAEWNKNSYVCYIFLWKLESSRHYIFDFFKHSFPSSSFFLLIKMGNRERTRETEVKCYNVVIVFHFENSNLASPEIIQTVYPIFLFLSPMCVCFGFGLTHIHLSRIHLPYIL